MGEVEAAIDSRTDARAVVGTSTLVRPQRPTCLKHSQHETVFTTHLCIQQFDEKL